MSLESYQLPELFYLLLYQSFFIEKNTWEFSSANQYLWKIISFLNKKYFEKSTATFPTINMALPRPKLIVKPIKPILKQKHGRSAKNRYNMQAKKWERNLL